MNAKPLQLFSCLVTEAAKLSKGESPGTSSDAILVDMDTGAEVTATNSLWPEKTHDVGFLFSFLRWEIGDLLGVSDLSKYC